MKKFILKILFFCVAFFILDKMFYVFLYVSPILEKDNRLEKVINGEINKDLLVLGSSIGARDIIAGQIEDSLNITSYNLSYPGSDIVFHEFILRTVLKFNKAPKILLLTVDSPSMFLPNKTINFRLDRLYPLAKYNYINDEMMLRGERNFLSKFLVIARTSKVNFNIKEKQFSNLDTIIQCGSMPISFQRNDIKIKFNKDNIDYKILDELPNKVNSFLKIKKLCVSNNIKLYLVFPPYLKNKNYSFEKRINKIASPEVSFLYYDTLNMAYKDKSFYYDGSHLQYNGAKIFTNEIIQRIKKDFN